MAIVARFQIEEAIHCSSSETFNHVIYLWGQGGIPHGHSIERLQIMNHAQSSIFLFHSEEGRMVRCARWLVFSATHLFLHYSDYFFLSSLRQSNWFPLPWLVRNHPYHVVGVIPLTKSPTFQIGKGNCLFILKEYMD